MAVVIPSPPVQPTTGGLIGQGLGQSLMDIITQKTDQMKYSKGLQALGLPKEQAKSIALLPIDLQKAIMPKLLEGVQSGKALGDWDREYGFEQEVAPQGGLSDMLATPVDYEGGAARPAQGGLSDMLATPVDYDSGVAIPEQRVEGVPGAQQVSRQRQPTAELGYEPGVEGRKVLTAGGTRLEALKVEREVKKESVARKEKMTEKEGKAWDAADPYINDIMEKSKGSRIQNMDLERMSELDEELTGPAWDAFLKGSGFDLDALRSPASNEFESIKMSFMKDMKKYFGGNVSTREMDAFLRTLPTLSQSPEGRKRIIANMKRLNNITIEYAKATKSVIKDNEGIPPRDLRFKVEKKMKKRVKTVADQFKKDLARPVPDFTSVQKAQTAIAHGVGSLIGAAPKLVSGLTGMLGRLGG